MLDTVCLPTEAADAVAAGDFGAAGDAGPALSGSLAEATTAARVNLDLELLNELRPRVAKMLLLLPPPAPLRKEDNDGLIPALIGVVGRDEVPGAGVPGFGLEGTSVRLLLNEGVLICLGAATLLPLLVPEGEVIATALGRGEEVTVAAAGCTGLVAGVDGKEEDGVFAVGVAAAAVGASIGALAGELRGELARLPAAGVPSTLSRPSTMPTNKDEGTGSNGDPPPEEEADTEATEEAEAAPARREDELDKEDEEEEDEEAPAVAAAGILSTVGEGTVGSPITVNGESGASRTLASAAASAIEDCIGEPAACLTGVATIAAPVAVAEAAATAGFVEVAKGFGGA
jgi:hypothetical protein